ncbi:MAG: glycerol-3-phosphate 1-O-acyltransferase PlsY [Lachnospiraceae bacterium]|nr:glycerol-3-phosphate 1-O-acyltransferase PlsY [Lachnospiraceae bacterium]MBR4993339.1 glycerol-3-phosphate 1-O-acyltransferase PlsY [Lachnospiraceae bacterium]
MIVVGLRLISMIVGYVFGTIQTAYFYGKTQGIDIREHGSGNAGTTNTLRVLGPKAGLIVFAGDAGKCILAVLLIRFTLGELFPDLRYLFVMYAALGAILGHDYPFFMGFKGGKGIACTAGLCLSINPWFIPVAAFMFLVPFSITKFVSLGSLLMNLGLMVQMVVMGQMGMLGTSSQATLIEIYVITFIIVALAYYQHRANIGRLIHGNERKTYIIKKNESK